MNEIERLLEEYVRQFGEALPLSMVHMTEEDLLQVLRDCLSKGKPYELPEDVRRLMEQGIEF